MDFSTRGHYIGHMPSNDIAEAVANLGPCGADSRTDNSLVVERHDVFDVLQVTRDTDLEGDVGVDIVAMEPAKTSSIHRHNLSETVLYFVEGNATVTVDDNDHAVAAGDRLRIGKGEFHGVRTGASSCRFISVQMPPILNKTTGFRDLEKITDENRSS